MAYNVITLKGVQSVSKVRQQGEVKRQTGNIASSENHPELHQDIPAISKSLPQVNQLSRLSIGHRKHALQRLQKVSGNNSIQSLIQRDDDDTNVVTGRPLTVTAASQRGAEQGVPNLESLSSGFSVSRGAAVTARNTPDPTSRLPFDRTGQNWDANAILTSLGQYDRISGTDSDTDRCVQAVALASYIPSGPRAVTGYIASAILDGMMTQTINTRRRTALRVLRNVQARIEAARATYGDLSWAQEALHGLFYRDDQAPAESEAMGRITPTLANLTRTTENLDIWCNTPSDVITQANQLAPSGQLILTEWRVTFNHTFQLVREAGHTVRSPMTVNLNGRSVRIQQIDTSTRPQPQQIDPNRDRKQGHQIMIMRDNIANGSLRIYEPEVTTSGQHLGVLNAGALTRYFQHNPSASMYRYIHIIGRIDPRDPLALPSGS
jgi:hypothetical protein